MNLYFLVEGRRTEKRIYTSWLAHAFPELKLVQRPEDVTENCVRLIVGGGYPHYLKLIGVVLDEIEKHANNRVNRLFICVDAEGWGYDARYQEIFSWVTRKNPQVSCSIVVQDCCIETWLLGNRRFLKRNPQDDELLEYKNFYDVGELDPERMVSPPSCPSRVKFHERYLKAMFRERGCSYTKKNPEPATDARYLEALAERYDDTRHLESFGRLITEWRSLGAQLQGPDEDDLA